MQRWLSDALGDEHLIRGCADTSELLRTLDDYVVVVAVIDLDVCDVPAGSVSPGDNFMPFAL